MRRERGQVLAIVAVILPVILGMCVLVVDLGAQITARVIAQQAVDAGALAGVPLCSNWQSADAASKGVAQANTSGVKFMTLSTVKVMAGSCNTVVCTTPWAPSTRCKGALSRRIGMEQLEVTASVPRYFAAIFGEGPGVVKASARAEMWDRWVMLDASGHQQPDPGLICNKSTGKPPAGLHCGWSRGVRLVD